MHTRRAAVVVLRDLGFWQCRRDALAHPLFLPLSAVIVDSLTRTIILTNTRHWLNAAIPDGVNQPAGESCDGQNQPDAEDLGCRVAEWRSVADPVCHPTPKFCRELVGANDQWYEGGVAQDCVGHYSARYAMVGSADDFDRIASADIALFHDAQVRPGA